MAEPILWLGGWASDLACWRDELAGLYPGREHRFLDAHAVLAAPGRLATAAAGLDAGATLVAWSLGSLILHKTLAAGWRPACRLVSASPVFDFCRADGPWPPAAVKRMSRRLQGERAAVLAEFRSLALGNSGVTHPGRAEAWTRQASAYPADSLAAGLAYLAETRAVPAEVPAGARHFFLASAHDPIAPLARPDIAGRNWAEYPEGHTPFLDYPALLSPFLAEAG